MSIPNESDSPTYDAIFDVEAVPPVPLAVESVSRFFYLSLAISAWKQAGDARWALRCNPSSGNLHPTEGYAILPGLEGLSPEAAVYHYAPREHGLERRVSLDAATWAALTTGFPASSWLVGLSSVHWREAWKYGERAFRYCQHDVGHALAGLRIAAATLGWRLRVLEHLADEDVARVLGLDREQDFSAGADEPEHPDLLAVVYPGDVEARVPRELDEAAIAAVAGGTWRGQANRLSGEHVADWEIIDAVAEATHKPKTASAPTPDRHGLADATMPPASSSGCGMSAVRIIRCRRSAVAFDGTTSITAESFYLMLARVIPSHDAVPWDAVSWTPRIHLLMFVHLVDGLPPGLYALVRRPGAHEALRRATKPEFNWTRPEGCPDDLPLFLLEAGDVRRVAAQLSLGQDIAGMSAFSLGMIAEFDEALDEDGPWSYRRLFWEAGMIGQVLYLEAEAAGVRATGIGAYFDDLVHEVFGLTGHTFQSMYHFTVGGPVDDHRLTTLPAYPPAG